MNAPATVVVAVKRIAPVPSIASTVAPESGAPVASVTVPPRVAPMQVVAPAWRTFWKRLFPASVMVADELSKPHRNRQPLCEIKG